MATAIRRSAVYAGVALAIGVGGSQLDAQQVTGDRMFPSNQVVITGYGTVGYGIRTQGENDNAFNSSISPVFLFQFQDRILVGHPIEADDLAVRQPRGQRLGVCHRAGRRPARRLDCVRR